MNLKLLKPAQTDVASAIAYYNAEEPGLGADFAKEIRKTLERILQYRKAWAQVSKRTRRCQVNPYGVFYSLKDDIVVVIAVLHSHRQPRTWQTRED